MTTPFAGRATSACRKVSPGESRNGFAVIAFAILLLLLTPSAFSQTTYTNLPISCARAAGLQANVANCSDTEQFQRQARNGDVVLACSAANCGWLDPTLMWRKWEDTPANYFVTVCPTAQLEGLMNCPGASSPIWGGLTKIAKSLVRVAPVTTPPPPTTGQLPPLTSGETYVVTWTQPTTNTDGTPIGTITKTQVQASTTADFAAYYSWDATLPGAMQVTVVNGPTGTVYWRARVFVGTTASDYSATAITERQWVSQTKPPCWPKPVGTGTWVKASQNTTGFALYWQCTVNGVAGHHGFMGLWSQLKPDWMAQLANAIEQGSLGALWDTNITGPSEATQYATVRPLYDALKAANPLPVVTPPTYVVKPNAGYATRPAYALVDGARTSVVAGRVNVKDAGGVPVPCDCTAYRGGAEPNLYCAVTGQENTATATAGDKLGPAAAVCTAAP